MRELHSFSDKQLAQRLLSVLQVQNMPAVLEEENGTWVLWIQNDDDRQRARELLEQFQTNPNATEYVEAETQAKRVVEEKIRQVAERQRRVVDLRDRWNGVWYKTYPATVIMIAASFLVVVLCTRIENDNRNGLPALCNDSSSDLRKALLIQAPLITIPLGNGADEIPGKRDVWATIKSGQIWRFVTPIFLHFSVLHILFNMSMLRQLGFAVEFVRGTRRFVLMVLMIAIISNLTQLYWSGPNFGGMSGVAFGLTGYVWMKGKYEPKLGLGLTPNQVIFSLLFLLLCMGGAIGNVANACHVAGLLTGMAFGVRRTMLRRLKQFVEASSVRRNND